MPSIFAPNWQIDDVSAIVFDKDGTIVDSHLYWGEIVKRRANQIVRHYGIDNSNFSKICKFMGYSIETGRLVPEGPVALVSRSEVISMLIHNLARVSVYAKKEELENIFNEIAYKFEADYSSYLKILGGVEKLIYEANKLGIKLALITSDSLFLTEKMLSDMKLRSFFDVVFGRESFNESKTTGVSAKKALEIMGIDRENTIAIGDAPADAEMSENAQLKAAILVSSGQIIKEDLSKHTKFVVNSLDEVFVR